MKPDYTLLDQTAQALGCPLRVDEPMARHTTFQIGGPADRFLTVENAAQLQGLLSCLRQAGIPYLVLGKGSNLLVSDKGIRGAVLHLGGDFKKVEVLPDGRTLRAGAGAPLASVCALARERSLTGLEFAWGIPGSAGGGAYMDAGAYGGEMRDVVSRVLHLGPDGTPGEARGEELCFGYRKSRYTGGEDIITAVEFTLQPGDPAAIAGKMEELMGRRKDKQPYDMPSAGSVFKRPQNGFAAALIEQCGLKGRRVGGAQVSEKHAGFIVNTGGATCQDVLELISIIQKTVEEQTGTRLECEVRVTGEE
ncbi:MAG TPA: UDP-N-acetylmuramate dehydrogenase [Candidatus Acutalibacter stercorigallinarum]|nr:UDP-N-acetylmuramate dehydrogenase [Candidatus Acutalibacter stercorigallinarum]